MAEQHPPSGEGIIFLVSQPRAGSTLLQCMLGAHPEIHTVDEPWMMLPPLYPLRHEVCKHAYDLQLAKRGMRETFDSDPNAEEAYFQGLRRMYTHFYGELASAAGKRVFLDKTPRYYSILPELRRTFPKARIIALIRNPVAVLFSMVNTWTSTRHLYALYLSGADLLEAPQCLAAAIENVPDIHVMHYESLVTNSQSELQRLSEYLGVAFDPRMLHYGRGNGNRLGDQSEKIKAGRPDSGNADRWKGGLTNAQLWTLANDYIEYLGPDLLGRLGQNYGKLREAVDAAKPFWLRRVLSVSLMTAVGGRRYHMPRWKKAVILGWRALFEFGPARFTCKSLVFVVRKLTGR